jgi:tetratricopeptide (TPR) repeat protein
MPSRSIAVTTRLMLVVVLCAAACGSPSAARQSPGAPGVPEVASRCLAGDRDAAGPLVNCTLAIEAGGLSTQLLALVYNARGEAHCPLGEYDLAIADQDMAIRLVPDFPQAYADRAGCHSGKNEPAAALADYDTAIRLAPRVPGYREERAMIENFMGKHDLALADFDEALKLAPRFNTVVDEKAKTLFDLGRYDEAAALFVEDVRVFPGDAFAVLWRHLARARARTDDSEEFKAGIATLRLSGWPAPLFDLLQGKASVEDVRRRQDQGDEFQEEECEIALFAGEDKLAKGDTTAAVPLVEEAASVCREGINEELTGWAEVKRLVPSVRDQGPW